jgi:NADH:ubiquinone oxidoreductase subunit 5 (subunit L)/multisubunit Na+/H+ antiporter MnhA subunit
VVTRAASQGRLEVGWMMQLPQVVLAFLCVLLGIVPVIALYLIRSAMDASQIGFGAVLARAKPMSNHLSGLESFEARAVFVPIAFLTVLGLMFFVSWLISRLGRAQRRAAAPWLCGYAKEAECHRYVAHNFYGEIKRYFRWLGGAPRAANGRLKRKV